LPAPPANEEADEELQRVIHANLQQQQQQQPQRAVAAAVAVAVAAEAEAGGAGGRAQPHGEAEGQGQGQGQGQGRWAWGYEELRRASEGFSNAQLLGEGAFGPVYRGRLAGRMVAIKVSSRSRSKSSAGGYHSLGAMPEHEQVRREDVYRHAGAARRGELEGMFRAEVEVLGRYHHPNLVELLGASQVTSHT
jgi:hypothetical protein